MNRNAVARPGITTRAGIGRARAARADDPGSS